MRAQYCWSSTNENVGYLSGEGVENITISNNYLDGSGNTRYWSSNGIFSQAECATSIESFWALILC